MDWKSVEGAAVKRRKLKYLPNADGVYLCPVTSCLHIGFKSVRGLRKHVDSCHEWLYYFEQQPELNRNAIIEKDKVRRKSTTHNVPSFTMEEGVGKEFFEWLQVSCGGGKRSGQAKEGGKRAMKFLMTCLGHSEVGRLVKEEYIDVCVGTPAIIQRFLRLATKEWGLSSSALLNYMKSVDDLMDFRKSRGVSDDVLRSFTATEVYVRRSINNLSKEKKIEYTRNLDLEQLICRDSWASLEEVEKVIPWHSPRYHHVLKVCKDSSEYPTITQLAYATRFIITFLFLRVKCSRPSTFKYITLDMVEKAGKNGGFIDQTQFKTEEKYAFDTVILSDDVMTVLQTYIVSIRPRMSPKCDFLLLTTTGNQYTNLGAAMNLLVHEAIGKYVHPTRYRQIIESESAEVLSPEEQAIVSKDQKHSSYVAKRMYQKRLSRDVAKEGQACMQKMVGAERDMHTKKLAETLGSMSDEGEEGNATPAPQSSHIQDVSSEVVLIKEKPPPIGEDLDEKEDIENDECPHVSTLNEEKVTVDLSKEAEIGECSKGADEVAAKEVEDLEVKKEEAENYVRGKSVYVQFTPEEDKNLRKGVEKYGPGRWSQIIKDQSLEFHCTRNRDTLRMRAGTIGITKTRKGRRKLNNN